MGILKHNKLIRHFLIIIRSLIKKRKNELNSIVINEAFELLIKNLNLKFTQMELRELLSAIAFYNSPDSGILISDNKQNHIELNYILPYYKLPSKWTIIMPIKDYQKVVNINKYLYHGRFFEEVNFNYVDLLAHSLEIIQQLLTFCNVRRISLSGTIKYTTGEKQFEEYVFLNQTCMKSFWDYYTYNFNVILNLLKKCWSIQVLHFQFFSFKSENITYLTNLLKNNPNIRSLSFENCKFEEGDYFSHDYLGYNSTLSKLEISDCFKNYHLHSFTKQFSGSPKVNKINTTLTELQIKNHIFNERSMEYIADILIHNQSIKILVLTANQITGSMLNPLKKLSKLTRLWNL